MLIGWAARYFCLHIGEIDITLLNSGPRALRMINYET